MRPLAVCTLSHKHKAKGKGQRAGEQRADDQAEQGHQGGQRARDTDKKGFREPHRLALLSALLEVARQISSGCSHSSPHEGAGGTEKAKRNWVQWLMPLLKARGRLRQEHYYEFKASLNYTARSWLINKQMRKTDVEAHL